MSKKISLQKKTILLIHPVLIVGSYDRDMKPNIMAASWAGICCSEPPCVGISLRKATYTYHNLMHSKAFTVNIPSERYLKESDYVGIYSGRDENKFETTGLKAVRSDYVNAPFIDEFPLILHCKVIHTTEIGLHTQFIGEIINVECDEEMLNEFDLPDINKIAPFMYDTSSRSYYSVGGCLSKAYTNLKE